MFGKTLVGLLATIVVTSIVPAAASAQFDHRPVRFWSFTESRKSQADTVVDSGSQQGGRLDVSHDFGPAIFDFEFPNDGVATGHITSSASGKTFDVYAQSPSGTERAFPIGGTSHLDHYQSYEKGPDASMRITISKAFIEAIDANGALLPSECPPALACIPEVGKVTFTARAYSADSEFFRVGGVAYLNGHQGNWDIDAVTQGSSKLPLWSKFTFNHDVDLEGTGSGTHAAAWLRRPVKLNVPLSSLSDGQLFAVHVSLDASTIDRRGRESGVSAYIKDPQQGPNALVETTGLTALGEPTFDEPAIDALPPADCPLGADPSSGTLQLSAPTYVTYESDAAGPFVLVTRTGGSVGAASATVTTSAGSADDGADYTEVATTVVFQDGDSSPRLVEIPILQDEDPESDETFGVSLSDPSCAPLGDQTAAEVTIADDDRPVEQAESFTIGGTVTGLEGSGLVLSNLGSELTIDADGAFEFSSPLPDAIPYHVSVSDQPSDPDQVCTVANGEGTIAGSRRHRRERGVRHAAAGHRPGSRVRGGRQGVDGRRRPRPGGRDPARRDDRHGWWQQRLRDHAPRARRRPRPDLRRW